MEALFVGTHDEGGESRVCLSSEEQPIHRSDSAKGEAMSIIFVITTASDSGSVTWV